MLRRDDASALTINQPARNPDRSNRRSYPARQFSRRIVSARFVCFRVVDHAQGGGFRREDRQLQCRLVAGIRSASTCRCSTRVRRKFRTLESTVHSARARAPKMNASSATLKLHFSVAHFFETRIVPVSIKSAVWRFEGDSVRRRRPAFGPKSDEISPTPKTPEDLSPQGGPSPRAPFFSVTNLHASYLAVARLRAGSEFCITSSRSRKLSGNAGSLFRARRRSLRSF